MSLPNDPPLRILCLSHLVWERNLFQRPQQLMTRFEALGHEVLYLTLMSSKKWLRLPASERTLAIGERGRAKNLPFVPGSKRFQPVRRLSEALLCRAGQAFLQGADPGRRVLWVQHPCFLPHLDLLPHDLLVYDCMDPFQSFSSTASHIPGLEKELLARADLVFTGGRSLHRQREGSNPNMHCFPSGIDYPHFARGAEPGPVEPAVAALKKPVLGYFGAVDERIDWELLRAVCEARPQWSVALIGPLVLMNRPPVELPNLHYLGPKPYDKLPEVLRGFDVCLIPWKVNELTRFMSPTKTPEYLASGRPVVSVPIPDVVDDYGAVVRVAGDSGAFIAACGEALAAGIGPSLKPEAARTWEETAEAMAQRIRQHPRESA
ncbi:MAG: glycosyltransferase [Sumerlaeia bacterium]